MPYKDKNKAKAYRRKWYQAHSESEKARISGIRTGIRTAIQTGIRTGSVQGSVQEIVQVPVSVPSQTQEVLTEADIARKKLIEDLKAKISSVPVKPMNQEFPVIRPRVSIPMMQENLSESVRYDYACYG